MKVKEHKESTAWYKKWWVWLIIIVVVFAIGNASKGGNTNTGSTATTPSTSTAQSSPSPAAPKQEAKTEYGLNETVNSDGKKITVTSIERDYQTGNQFSKPETGKEFVIVTVQIVNDSKSALDYNTFEFKMQDSNGVQQSEDFMALSEGKLSSGSLAPGGKVTGKISYQVPKGDAGLKLIYKNLGFFGDKPVTFKL